VMGIRKRATTQGGPYHSNPPWFNKPPIVPEECPTSCVTCLRWASMTCELAPRKRATFAMFLGPGKRLDEPDAGIVGRTLVMADRRGLREGKPCSQLVAARGRSSGDDRKVQSRVRCHKAGRST